MDTITIEYRFFLDNGRQIDFNLLFNNNPLEFVAPTSKTPPEWTALDFNQCSHCPLSKDTHPHCPVAINLMPIVEHFNTILSYQEVDVEVITAERNVRQHTSTQRAVSSLMGLLIGTSDCPHTTFFKSMARHHLPLATQEETTYRATSMFLLSQYLLKKDGAAAELSLDGLNDIYKNMEIINMSVAKRLRAATEADSSVNAIVLLDVYAKILPMAIEDSLEEIRYSFDPFIKQSRSQDS